jgi:hypothetical protein
MPRLNSPSEGACLRRISSWVPPPHDPSRNKIGSGSPGQREERPCGECHGHQGGCMSTLPLDCCSTAHAGTNRGPSRCSPDRTATPLGVPNMRAEMVCWSKKNKAQKRRLPIPKRLTTVGANWGVGGWWPGSLCIHRGSVRQKQPRRSAESASLGPRSTRHLSGRTIL